MELNELNNIIIKAFNYYNGKINIINNKAVLNINTAMQNYCYDSGYSKSPDIVTINPYVILRYMKDNNSIIGITVETVIHELFHTDQLINYNKYKYDKKYKECIENACELQTMIYMYSHSKELFNLFGLEICDYKYENISMYESYYKRRTYLDHIILCISALVSQNFENDIYNKIINSVNNKKDLYLSINKEFIPIYTKNNGIINIYDFNNYIRKYNCNGIYSNNVNIKDNIVDISLDNKNIMCIL